MANFDHHINDEVAEKLKKGEFYSQYAGHNFCGYVWWNKDKWSCEVWQHNIHAETFHGLTLKEIMTKVSDGYGYN